MKKCQVGGQAVLEGVMMRGSMGIATAVRNEDGEIEVDFKNTVPYTKKHKILSLPIIRGFVTLIESLIVGVESLNYSASIFEDTEPSKFEDWLRGKFGDKSNDIIMGITFVISLIFAIGIFVAIPTAVTSLLKGKGISHIILNIVEGALSVIMLLGYMYAIGKLEDINRVFQYHGAEHKTIFCYEHGEKLKVDNVKKYKRFHPRCGTNFLFLVAMVSILVFSFTKWDSVVQRIGLRIILLPVVAGITYEIIKWVGASEGKLAELIAKPGLKLQELTTREPDDSQIEVAIVALLKAEGLEMPKKTVDELLKYGNDELKKALIESFNLDTQLLLGNVLKKEKLWIITNRDFEVDKEEENKFKELIKLRKSKMPMKYILEETEFMGINLTIKNGVLIPRPDTEVLVEEVLSKIPEDKEMEICDLCSGSGAIGIALASFRKKIKVNLLDIEKIPEEVSNINITKLKLSDRVEFIFSDLLKEAIEENKKYDIIVSNPPYIRDEVIPTLMDDVKDYEPYVALSGGEDGLVFYRRIVDESVEVLKPGGMLAFEIGHDQGEDVKRLMEDRGYQNLRIVKDLAGLDRVVIGNLPNDGL
ncbi:protein-(glutamine-N5) methyltransferase, release factor-specific [Clostridium cavendishii DSM 21758]|uniref:Release factor glutamine methyltransferase n=1 Tax=Clostridium cavendishii DSM 21758 TaxID=1121302 RepID=A0A1M6U5B3_9CLOT|nr:peptide chain release factor N(5)-glutamine methyltransferase [Clostridium cavendishii]SHK64349.1 protein-(glutamine-N5) methyltransferase, release factor-specific [Clostridium cavendishii DSM 21758]